jgi:hypothetical protein
MAKPRRESKSLLNKLYNVAVRGSREMLAYAHLRLRSWKKHDAIDRVVGTGRDGGSHHEPTANQIRTHSQSVALFCVSHVTVI